MRISYQVMPTGFLPTRAHKDDAGYDLALPNSGEVLLSPGKAVKVSTAIRVLIPHGYVGKICPRSSISAKGVLTHEGTIDAGYTGEIKVVMQNLSPEPVVFKPGERIAQLVFLKLADIEFQPGNVNLLTDRGAGGFGSTGA